MLTRARERIGRRRRGNKRRLGKMAGQQVAGNARQSRKRALLWAGMFLVGYVTVYVLASRLFAHSIVHHQPGEAKYAVMIGYVRPHDGSVTYSLMDGCRTEEHAFYYVFWPLVKLDSAIFGWEFEIGYPDLDLKKIRRPPKESVLPQPERTPA